MKSILKGLVLFFCMSNVALATLWETPGYYFGPQLGYSRADEGSGFKELAQNIGSGAAPASDKIDQGGLGWRIYMGAQFNRYFGIETGYTSFANNEYDAQNASGASTHLKLKSFAWDVMGRAMLPLGRFFVYGEFGFARMMAELRGQINNSAVKSSYYKWQPAYGAGLGFTFTKRIAMDVSWLSIEGKNKVNLTKATNNNFGHFVPAGNFISVGLIFKLT